MRISATAFANYNKCPAKYKFSKDEPLDNINFDVGTLVHKILSEAPALIIEEKEEKIRERLIEEMAAPAQCNAAIISKCMELVKNGVDNIKQALHDGYVSEVEVPMRRTLPSGIEVSGIADRIDQTKKSFRIIDYKSGFAVPTKTDMLGDLQLLTYSYLSQEMATANQTVEICLFSLGRNVVQSIELPVEVEMVIEDILDIRAQQMAADTIYKPQPSSFCKFCDYCMKCRFWEEYKTKLEIPADINEAVTQLESVVSYQDGLDGIVSQLKEHIVEYMVANEIDSIDIGGKDKRIIQTCRVTDGKASMSKPYIRV